jgi:hypothetical protein
VLSLAADILIDVYAAESGVLRALNASPSAAANNLHVAVAQIIVNDAAARVEIAARNSLAAMADGDTLRTVLAALRRVLKVTPLNTVALRRQVADATSERKGYPF